MRIMLQCTTLRAAFAVCSTSTHILHHVFFEALEGGMDSVYDFGRLSHMLGVWTGSATYCPFAPHADISYHRPAQGFRTIRSLDCEFSRPSMTGHFESVLPFDEMGLQDKGRAESYSFLGVGSGAFKDNSASGTNQFVDTVDEAIKHWTKMWEEDARYDNAVASNVQVTSYILHLDHYKILSLVIFSSLRATGTSLLSVESIRIQCVVYPH